MFGQSLVTAAFIAPVFFLEAGARRGVWTISFLLTSGAPTLACSAVVVDSVFARHVFLGRDFRLGAYAPRP